MMYTDSRTDIFLGYDFSGNCSAYTITGSQLDDNISLSAETDSIYIGEEVTIQNTDVDDSAMLLKWEVSDPEIAEIVSSDSSDHQGLSAAIGYDRLRRRLQKVRHDPRPGQEL